jgi:Acetoacetate decarboxylase (ADC)
MPPSQADYIYYGGAALPPPPYTCNQTRFMALPCAGDRDRIQKFIERTLNAASSPGRYSTISSYVFLAIVATEASGSATPPFSGYGIMSETDIGFWIPVTDKLDPFSILWYPAYLFVDNWMAVIGGREIWGFPKAWADIKASPRDPRDGIISVSTLALKTLEPNARAEMAEIFRLAPGVAPPPTRNTIAGAGLIAALTDLLDRALFLELIQLMKQLSENSRFTAGSPMIFLKQIRDAASTTAAAYRAVITANATMTALLGPPSLKGEHCLTLNDFASQPIAADLGLAIGDQTLPFAICADIDFTMELARPVRAG